MANSIADLEALPDIDMLAEDGITLDSIREEMIADYQEQYNKENDTELTLYPAHPRRLELNVIAGQIYQAYEFAQYLFKQNLIRYMDDDVLWNWGANLGFSESNLAAARCSLEFYTSEELAYPVTIPAGTRATAGDDVYFAADADCTIEAGETTATVGATCTEKGSTGNGYAVGQIDILADPILNVAGVKNVVASAGGADEYSGDDLREKIFLFPSTYSVAGPQDAYEYYVRAYSTDIISVNVTTDKSTAVVKIYIMLSKGNVPDEQYCKNVLEYLQNLKRFPDTDKIEILSPEVVEYALKASYYISTSSRDTESTIKSSVESAAKSYMEYEYSNLGYDLNPDVFREYARVAGAKRLEITEPVYQALEENQIAVCTGIELTYGGLEDD